MRKAGLTLGLVLWLVAMVFAPAKVVAQDCTGYYMFEDNAEYELLTFDRKDKQTGKMHYKVVSVSKGPAKTAAVHSKMYDHKGELTAEGDYTVRCQGGTIWIDMNSMVNPNMLEAYKNMKVQMQGDQIDYPSVLAAGQKLKDGSLTIDVLDKQSGQPLSTMVMNVTNRTVGGKENITVPAGTYSGYKISQDMEMRTKAMGINMPGMRVQTVEYFVPGVGMVRSETYRNGKLMAYSVLNKVNK